ncbi:MAG TPA: hypothetical protein VMT00_02065 [Thermoanaerobaculia bacterium]|nr:hypothetical protein [Thermoanaerobaculia bacterium]
MSSITAARLSTYQKADFEKLGAESNVLNAWRSAFAKIMHEVRPVV